MLGCYHCRDIGHLNYNCPKFSFNASRRSTFPSDPAAASTATPNAICGHQTQPRHGVGRCSGSMIQGGGQPRLYAALDRRSAEISSAVVTGNLSVCGHDAYVLIDLGSTFSYSLFS